MRAIELSSRTSRCSAGWIWSHLSPVKYATEGREIDGRSTTGAGKVEMTLLCISTRVGPGSYYQWRAKARPCYFKVMRFHELRFTV